jgi:hypothetical protein
VERRLSVLLATLGVAGAVVWIGVAGKRTQPTGPIDSALADLERTVRETAAATHVRASTLSQLPGVSWAIATDAETIHDLMTDELAFRPQAGESIEIAQVERVGGAIHRLIIIPPDGRPALSASAPGLHLVTDGDQVRITAVMKVEPQGREQIVSGLVGVAHRIDVSRMAGRFEALGIAARLETSSGSAAIGNARSRAGGVTVVRALQSPAADGAKLIVQMPRGIAWDHVSGALMLLFASIVSAKLLARRGPHGPGQAPAAGEKVNEVWLDDREDPTLVGAEAGMLMSNDDKTPTSNVPIGPPELHVLTSRTQPGLQSPSSLPRPAWASRMSMTIPSALFVAVDAVVGGQTPVLPATDNPWQAEYRRLFKEFIKLRVTCNESTEDLDADRFIQALHQKRLEVMGQNGVVDVKFQLAFDNGKAAVRFKVQDFQPHALPSAKETAG